MDEGLNQPLLQHNIDPVPSSIDGRQFDTVDISGSYQQGGAPNMQGEAAAAGHLNMDPNIPGVQVYPQPKPNSAPRAVQPTKIFRYIALVASFVMLFGMIYAPIAFVGTIGSFILAFIPYVGIVMGFVIAFCMGSMIFSISAAIISAVVYWLEFLFSDTFKFLKNMQQMDNLFNTIYYWRKQPCQIVFTVTCYHLETRLRHETGPNGQMRTRTETVKVPTYSESEIFQYKSWSDMSPDLEILTPTNSKQKYLKMHVTKKFTFGDSETERLYQEQSTDLVERNRYRDSYIDLNVDMQVPQFKPKLFVVYNKMESEEDMEKQRKVIDENNRKGVLSWPNPQVSLKAYFINSLLFASFWYKKYIDTISLDQAYEVDKKISIFDASQANLLHTIVEDQQRELFNQQQQQQPPQQGYQSPPQQGYQAPPPPAANNYQPPGFQGSYYGSTGNANNVQQQQQQSRRSFVQPQQPVSNSRSASFLAPPPQPSMYQAPPVQPALYQAPLPQPSMYQVPSPQPEQNHNDNMLSFDEPNNNNTQQ